MSTSRRIANIRSRLARRRQRRALGRLAAQLDAVFSSPPGGAPFRRL
jgi:hypothetical protein